MRKTRVRVGARALPATVKAGETYRRLVVHQFSGAENRVIGTLQLAADRESTDVASGRTVTLALRDGIGVLATHVDAERVSQKAGTVRHRRAGPGLGRQCWVS